MPSRQSIKPPPPIIDDGFESALPAKVFAQDAPIATVNTAMNEQDYTSDDSFSLDLKAMKVIATGEGMRLIPWGIATLIGCRIVLVGLGVITVLMAAPLGETTVAAIVGLLAH